MPKAIGPVSNDASRQIASLAPYSVEVTIQGTTSMLFHRCRAWEARAVHARAPFPSAVVVFPRCALARLLPTPLLRSVQSCPSSFF